MSECKHTKEVLGVSSGLFVMSKAGQIIANCQPTGVESLDVPFEEAIANAALFAAASNMLDACKELLKDITPINISRMGNGKYLGMFAVHGHRLEDMKAAIDQAEKK